MFVSVPVALMLVPFNWRADIALTLATESVPVVPLSVKVRRVFGVPSASLIVKTPLVPVEDRVTFGVALEKVIGLACEKVLA